MDFFEKSLRKLIEELENADSFDEEAVRDFIKEIDRHADPVEEDNEMALVSFGNAMRNFRKCHEQLEESSSILEKVEDSEDWKDARDAAVLELEEALEKGVNAGKAVQELCAILRDASNQAGK